MGEFDNLHRILLSLYDEMMPLCADMTGVSKGLAGLGALFYVAVRVWQSLARAEAIDVYPLLRPFAIGLCILFFPTVVLGTMNSVLSPIVQGTHAMLESQTFDMNEYREQKDRLEYEAMMRNPETAYLASDEEFDRQLEELGWSPSDLVTMTGMYMDRASYNIKKTVRDWFREVLELMFAAAALIIDTLRTFFLVVLSILGPVAFAFSVWDGFHSTLSAWFSRYIQIYLWLPVSDLFSTILAKIQILMLQNDIEAMQADPDFSVEASNGVYIVFLIIGIVGYFTIPTVSGWIIQAGGGTGNYNRNVNTAGALGGSVAGAAAGNVAGRGGKLIKSAGGHGEVCRREIIQKKVTGHMQGYTRDGQSSTLTPSRCYFEGHKVLLCQNRPETSIINPQKKRTVRNGIQVIKEHRDELPADTPVRNHLHGGVRPRGGLLGGVRLPFRRSAEAEDIRPRRGQEPDARALAGPVAEPSGGSQGTRAPFS